MLDRKVLDGFCGTEAYHRWSPLFRNVVLTDGAKYVAEHGGGQGAFWLMDAIASQIWVAREADEMCADFQVWTLEVKPDKSATLTCVADTGREPAATQRIEYTDFDPEGITLWVEPGGPGGEMVILLPSEH